jgi:hypothetical protein
MRWTTEPCQIPGTLAALRMRPGTAAPRATLATWMGTYWLTWVGVSRGEIHALDVDQWCAVPMWPGAEKEIA